MKEINKNYWAVCLSPPLSPSEEDVEIYKSYLIEGDVLLLGCTHKLIELSTNQMDIDPWYQSKTIITRNWIDNDVKYSNIIGDGVLNFTKELCDNVLKMCSKYSDTLIVRSFNYKLEPMKIADHFPNENDFIIKPNKSIKFDEYSFYIWRFHE
jgi:hypothetical protein